MGSFGRLARFKDIRNILFCIPPLSVLQRDGEITLYSQGTTESPPIELLMDMWCKSDLAECTNPPVSEDEQNSEPEFQPEPQIQGSNMCRDGSFFGSP